MKKLFFVLSMFLSVAYADEYRVSITAKIVPLENKGYYILSDGSIWGVTSFVKRWRTPGEWLLGEELFVPENFNCNPQDWSVGDEVEIISRFDRFRLDPAAASNEDEIRKYTHHMVNCTSDKMLYAAFLHPAEFMSQLYDNAYSVGYGYGYSTGYSSGHSSGYSSGYSNGYTAGQAALQQKH